MGRDDIETTQAELEQQKARAKRLRFVFSILGLVVIAVFTVPAAALGLAIGGDGPMRWPMVGIVAAGLGLPVLYLTSKATEQQALETEAAMDSLRRELTDALHEAEHQANRREAQVRRQEFESQLANALEMGEGEPEIIDVVERAFSTTLPETPVELLLADNSHAHLQRMAVSATVGGAPMCTVDSPDHCPAARRAQVQRFGDSEALDACPKLRNRPEGRCSAVCVPVSIMGRTVGVIHATGEPHVVVDDNTVQDLQTLANLAGARIGLLRMVADTQLQAATDSLTGLVNRRSLENKFLGLRGEVETLTAVMADLDNFKALNDTYGHETGDRALRLFAQVLRTSMRSVDVVSRHGGEEFALLLPGCSAADAAERLESVRSAVSTAVARAGLPTVTASFGVVEASPFEDLSDMLARADVALLQAKRDGRDRIVVHDPAGNETELSAVVPIFGA